MLPNLGSGVQLTALNLSGSALVWNAANQMLYAAPGSVQSCDFDVSMKLEYGPLFEVANP
jgi:hypothetical protein